MRVEIDNAVTNRFPEARIFAVVATNLRNFDAGVVDFWRAAATDRVRSRQINPELLTLEPDIKAWRDAYQLFGLKPSKFRSSIEQLYKRALKGDLIATRLPVVNLYCYVSVVHMLPAGAYDLSRVNGDITIRLTAEGEPFQAIGEKSSIPAKAGVICYADNAGVVCYGWNWRDADRTALSSETDSAIFFIDTVGGSTSSNGELAIRDLSAALEEGGALVQLLPVLGMGGSAQIEF